MGMFDYVYYETVCRVCDGPINEFQSKDGPCELKHLKPKHVKHFNAICHHCGASNYFKVKRKCVATKIKRDDI